MVFLVMASVPPGPFRFRGAFLPLVNFLTAEYLGSFLCSEVLFIGVSFH